MTHATKQRTRSFAAMAAAGVAATLLTACTGQATATSSNEAVGDKLAPSIYCGDTCQGQLELKADPAGIECKVGVSWSSASFPYGAKSTQQIPEFAKAFFPKMNVTVSDGRGDATNQSNQVSEMIAQGIKVLILSPQDANALAGVAKQATAAGIKVIAADRQVNAEVSTYIGSDNEEAGVVDGKAVAEALGGTGSVVELSGSLGASPTIARAAGFRKGLEGSNVEVIASQTANYDRATGLKVMEDLLQRFGTGKIQAVYAHNDQMAFGAIQAIKEAGREGEIKVFGIDGEAEALDLVKDGSYAATVGYPLVVKESTIAAAKLCAGEPVEPRIKLDSTLIDQTNVDQYLGKAPQ
ncbi:UNVERIFIED_CONTAM: substrate-binding domain-containing protein [Actinomycetes bacterium ARC8]|uniref:substrate-binding domain-containing protein n=1 Tax=Pseudarthrobacter sp. NCCP-2145 TaxID=2942290 RepID=UPI0020415EA1|nr:substrate-binding domain-containing protein [Pseudarthrobacter sp. NCCP-2145]MDV2979773.1 substrate-binding domain-containing protein [Actinomycetes bacterium ARC8]GKV73556.1 D-ribose ABC transporter substrate-binding protein [Pseudarthrobacter sp. NCCP-2145]